MAKLTKKRKEANAKFDADKAYSLTEAAGVLKEVSYTKFDSSVDLHVRLGVDPRKADQMVRGVVALPHGTGKTVRVLVLCSPDKEADAKAAGAKVVGTGRSDFPNQVNNVLAFPGIFRGALDVRATHINEKMKVAAVKAIAGLIKEHELNEDYVIPAPFDARVAPAVAAAVAKAAMETGVARINVDPEEIKEKTKKLAIIGKSEE